jgi:hypothetical protein
VIRIGHREPAYMAEDKTGSNGTWRESVPDLGLEYEVTLTHGQERLSALARAGDLRVDFVLPALARLPVRVLDAASGRPLASWELYWRPHGQGPLRRGLARDHSGQPEESFVLEVLPGVVDLMARADDSGHRSRRIDALLLGTEATPPLEIRLEPGLELDFTLADGAPHPDAEGVILLLLEAEAWADVRVGRNAAGDIELSGGVHYPGVTLWERVLAFGDDRRATLLGLAPGRWRLKAFPDDVMVEPDSVTLPAPRPLVVGWRRR